MAEESSTLGTMGAALNAAQSLPTLPKCVITVVVLLISSMVCWLLWQKPAKTHGQGQMAGEPSQAAQAISLQQLGGVNAGIYYNYQSPPATDIQKEQAKASLKSELDELKAFPDRTDAVDAPTLLQRSYKPPLAHRLFVILDRYYGSTIKGIPTVGTELYEFKKSYLEFEEKAKSFETNIVTQIGKAVAVRFRPAWEVYYRYVFFRSVGFSEQQIVEGGSFLNYGITWNDAEKFFNEIQADGHSALTIKEQMSTASRIHDSAVKILAELP